MIRYMPVRDLSLFLLILSLTTHCASARMPRDVSEHGSSVTGCRGYIEPEPVPVRHCLSFLEDSALQRFMSRSR